jgi:organic hydroperoxide reductase OsmC/OhrA
MSSDMIALRAGTANACPTAVKSFPTPPRYVHNVSTATEAFRTYRGGMTTHHYRARLAWRGSTVAGYRAYDRGHVVETPPAANALDLSADAAFHGDPTRTNPEQLLLAAASSCLLLSFLAVAARSGLDVVGYDDHAEAHLDGDRLGGITLRPRITVAGGADADRVRDAVHAAHRGCYIANSLSVPVQLEPEVFA